MKEAHQTKGRRKQKRKEKKNKITHTELNLTSLLGSSLTTVATTSCSSSREYVADCVQTPKLS